LAHRDYSSAARGAQVQVEMHPDRVVIRNPGGLFGPVTLDSLGEPGVSSSRNATLFRLLQDTPLPDGGPVCENLGSGIPVMVRELRAIGLPPPRFADSPVRFEVTFLNHTLLDPEALAWVGRVAPEGLSISQTEALVELRRGAWFTNRDYRNRFLLDSQDARTELTDLVRRGLVITEGARRWTRYGINPATLSPASEVRLTNAKRATLQALADGALGRAELEERLAVSGRAVLLRLDALLDANPPLVTREGKTRSPNTDYGLTEAGRAALQAIDQDT
jgi:ATP-dependent DNA helicase RecG